MIKPKQLLFWSSSVITGLICVYLLGFLSRSKPYPTQKYYISFYYQTSNSLGLGARTVKWSSVTESNIMYFVWETQRMQTNLVSVVPVNIIKIEE